MEEYINPLRKYKNQNHGMTNYKIGRLVRQSPQSVSNILSKDAKGLRQLSVDTIIKYIDYLGINLIGDTHEINKK